MTAYYILHIPTGEPFTTFDIKYDNHGRSVKYNKKLYTTPIEDKYDRADLLRAIMYCYYPPNTKFIEFIFVELSDAKNV